MARYLAAAMAAGILLVAFLGVEPARADQDDPRLDQLFKQLKSADDADEAEAVTSEIWSIWRHSGIPAIDWMMQESRRFMYEGHLNTALGGFALIIDAAPDFAEGWHKRATVQFLLGNYAASIEDIEKTVDLEPRHFGAYAGLGLIYLKMGEERAALKALERALQINPHLRGTEQKVRELRLKLDGRPI